MKVQFVEFKFFDEELILIEAVYLYQNDKFNANVQIETLERVFHSVSNTYFTDKTFETALMKTRSANRIIADRAFLYGRKSLSASTPHTTINVQSYSDGIKFRIALNKSPFYDFYSKEKEKYELKKATEKKNSSIIEGF